MSRKTDTKLSTLTGKPRSLTVIRRPDEPPGDALAKASLRPSVQAALTLDEFNQGLGELSLDALVDNLVTQCEAVRKGDLSRPEAMMVTQAQTLNAIFHNLARRASANMDRYTSAAEMYLRLALKAQSQCRTTLEALAAIKSPPVVYAQQANISAGPQQINNHGLSLDPGKIEQTKVLEVEHAERLDTRAPTQAVRNDQDMATVGAIDRAANRAG
jgi:hypothetical protein